MVLTGRVSHPRRACAVGLIALDVYDFPSEPHGNGYPFGRGGATWALLHHERRCRNGRGGRTARALPLGRRLAPRWRHSPARATHRAPRPSRAAMVRPPPRWPRRPGRAGATTPPADDQTLINATSIPPAPSHPPRDSVHGDRGTGIRLPAPRLIGAATTDGATDARAAGVGCDDGRTGGAARTGCGGVERIRVGTGCPSFLLLAPQRPLLLVAPFLPSVCSPRCLLVREHRHVPLLLPAGGDSWLHWRVPASTQLVPDHGPHRLRARHRLAPRTTRGGTFGRVQDRRDVEGFPFELGPYALHICFVVLV